MALSQTPYHLGLQWGLNDRMARLYHAFAYWSIYYNLPIPEIISGYRSPDKQASLRRRWDAGDRRGLAVRPARNSLHSARMAFDLKANPYSSWYGSIAAHYGYGWGGDFRGVSDSGHFFYA